MYGGAFRTQTFRCGRGVCCAAGWPVLTLSRTVKLGRLLADSSEAFTGFPAVSLSALYAFYSVVIGIRYSF